MSRQVIKVQMTPPITSDSSDPFHLQLHCHYSATETEKKNKFLELHGTASLKVHAVIKVLESVKAAIVLEWPFLFVSLQLAGRRGGPGKLGRRKKAQFRCEVAAAVWPVANGPLETPFHPQSHWKQNKNHHRFVFVPKKVGRIRGCLLAKQSVMLQ